MGEWELQDGRYATLEAWLDAERDAVLLLDQEGTRVGVSGLRIEVWKATYNRRSVRLEPVNIASMRLSLSGSSTSG